jgi:hypothetical protein
VSPHASTPQPEPPKNTTLTLNDAIRPTTLTVNVV